MLTVQSIADPSQTVRTHIWPGMHFDFAISYESDLLGPGEENRLKDCLRYYRQPIDSLEKLLEVRGEMNLEGPRWWREPEHGGIVWMPRRYWGITD